MKKKELNLPKIKRTWGFTMILLQFTPFIIAAAVYPFYQFINVDTKTKHVLFQIFLTCFAVFGLFNIYGKLIENKYLTIYTNLSTEKNYEIIYDIIKQNKYLLTKNTDTYVVCIRVLGSIHSTITLAYFENKIIFNILSTDGVCNYPPLFLKAKMIRLIRKAAKVKST